MPFASAPRAALTVCLALASFGACAALKVGDKAPDFSTDAALGGSEFKFSMAEALKKGPVVLYFYPKAFTGGCTVEAHDFAEATEKFNALGATVIGMSKDDIGTLKRFSVEACRNKFAVGADEDGKVIKQYDVALAMAFGLADRVSYVVAPDGKVIYTYASLNPDGHVANTLKAVEAWKAGTQH